MLRIQKFYPYDSELLNDNAEAVQRTALPNLRASQITNPKSGLVLHQALKPNTAGKSPIFFGESWENRQTAFLCAVSVSVTHILKPIRVQQYRDLILMAEVFQSSEHLRRHKETQDTTIV